MKFKEQAGVTVRGGVKRVPCEGSRSSTQQRLDAERGVCPVCGQSELLYDSSRVGHGLLVDHRRPVEASAKPS
jgi:hypothetical protein